MKPRSRRQSVYLAASRVGTRLTAHADPFCSGLSRAANETAVVAAVGTRAGATWEVTYRGEVAIAKGCESCGDADLSRRWIDFAACQGMEDLFFNSSQAARNEAKEVCARCPVLDPCLDYGLTIKAVAGVWGGKVFSGSTRPRRPKGRVRA